MIIPLKQVLPAETIAAIVAAMEGTALADGRQTAGDAVRHLKNNRELAAGSAEARRLGAMVAEALWRHPMVANLAMPRRFSDILFSAYETGMTYGSHIDNTVMGMRAGNPMRADMSMTIFLSPAASYDGGELVLEEEGETTRQVKLEAGDAVLYPTTRYHRVAPVTRGVRRAAVLWLQSMVREAEKRQVLTDLWMVLDLLHRGRSTEAAQKDAAFRRVERARADLYRLWAEV